MERSEIERVFEEYGNALYRLALFYVRSAADAEDVVQDVLLTYLQKGEGKSRAWLTKVTVNRCINLLKKKRRETAFDESDYAVSPIGDDLYEALGALSVKDREMVWMYYFGGYTTKEIAGQLHMGEAAVRKRMERARKSLRQYMEGS